jgi:glycosyltransferase
LALKRIARCKDGDLLDAKEKELLRIFKEEKKLFNKVDAIICLCEFTQKLLTEEYKIAQDKLLLLVSNGLKDESIILSNNEKQQLKQQLFIPNNEKIILFVGRLDEIKGLEYLIRAFKLVIDEDSNYRLIIIGEGDYSIYMKECKGYWGKITFTGRLEKDELYSFYQIADIGVLPSFHEQCSYVAIEMTMFGIPLIVTDATGAPESVINNRTGIVLPTFKKSTQLSFDERLLADKMRDLLKFNNRKIIREFYLRKYSKNVFKNNLLKIYS